MFETVIFDLDGTLVNSLYDLADSVNYALKSLNLPVRTYDEIRDFVGNGADVLLKKSLPADKQDRLDEALSFFSQHYGNNMLNKTKTYDGIDNLLKNLHDNGIKTAIVSNKPDAAVKKIAKLIFDGVIDTAIGADLNIRRKKPYPDAVYAAMDELGAVKRSTVYIGDSDVDVSTAKNSGLKCIGVTWGFRSIEYLEGADFIADSTEQIERIVLE